MSIRVTMACVAIAIAAATPSTAANIALSNTGVNNSGQVLASGASDTHYSLYYYDGGTNLPSPQVATSANGYPIAPSGPWLGDNSTSAWIGPVGDSALDGDYGWYVYHTTFNVTAAPSSASITGRFSADDFAYLALNDSFSWYANDFYNFYDFSLNSGFVQGENTLDFWVYNYGGPTGLRVEMTGSQAPEPASWALMLGGFGAIGGALRSRRKVTARFA